MHPPSESLIGVAVSLLGNESNVAAKSLTQRTNCSSDILLLSGMSNFMLLVFIVFDV